MQLKLFVLNTSCADKMTPLPWLIIFILPLVDLAFAIKQPMS